MLNNHFIKEYKNIPIAKYAYSCLKNNTLLMHTSPQLHKEFEIIFVEEGQAVITINQQMITASAGDLVFISPYMLHSLEIPPQENFSYICICFDLDLISDVDLCNKLINNYFCIKQHIKSDTVYNEYLRKIFLDINDAMDNAMPYWELIIRGCLSLMFGFLMQNNLKTNTFLYSYDKDFCIKVSKYIDSHYREKINSETISEELNYNQSYFCRLFKKNFSMCFSDYVNMYRIEKAKMLFGNKLLSITDIACETGFLSSSYFTKLFRIQNGITPKKFRDMYFNHSN